MNASDRTTANEQAELELNSHKPNREEELFESEVLDRAMSYFTESLIDRSKEEIIKLFVSSYPDLSAEEIALYKYGDQVKARLRAEERDQYDNN